MTINSSNSDLKSGSFSIPESKENAGFGRYAARGVGAYYKVDADTTFYSWGTATALTGSIDDSNTINGDAESTICPLSWTLPTKSEGNEIVKLYPRSMSSLVALGLSTLGYKWSDSSGFAWTGDSSGCAVYLTKTGSGNARPYEVTMCPNYSYGSVIWEVIQFDDPGFEYMVRCKQN